MSRVKTPEASEEPGSQSNGVRYADRLGAGSAEEHDALAELFLGESDPAPSRSADDEPPPSPAEPAPVGAARDAACAADGPRARPAAPSRGIDLVIAGHLPVMASAWVRQYAATRAPGEDRPAALVRLMRGRAAVELLGGGCDRMRVPAAESFEGALRVASESAGAWVVRVDEPFELDAAACEGLETLTVLTGADDAAMVAAYRLLKGLRDTVASHQEAGASLRVRIAVMGCDGARAEGTSSKLKRAAASCLGLDIEDAGGAARVTPARGVVVFDREGEAMDADALVRTLASMPAAEPTQRRSRPPMPTPTPVPPAPQAATAPQTDPAEPTEPTEPAETARGWTDPVFDLTSEPTDPAAFTPGLRTNPEPRRATAEVGHSTPIDDAEAPTPLPVQDGATAPPLWSLHGQLQPLHAGCPMVPGVELARDSHGRLHLLAWDGVPDGGVAGLTAAASWARSHSAWLGEPGGEGAGEPVLHLFTRDAVSARSLVWSEVRIHAVTPVETGEGVRWVRTPLN